MRALILFGFFLRFDIAPLRFNDRPQLVAVFRHDVVRAELNKQSCSNPDDERVIEWADHKIG